MGALPQMNREARPQENPPLPLPGFIRGAGAPERKDPDFKGEGGLLNAPAPGVQRFKAAVRRGFGPPVLPFESLAWTFKPPFKASHDL